MWHEFPLDLRLYLADGRTREFSFVILARRPEHVRVIGALLSFVYRAELAA